MNIIEKLRATELPGERQRHREARVTLGDLLNEAAAEIEKLRGAEPEAWIFEYQSSNRTSVFWETRLSHHDPRQYRDMPVRNVRPLYAGPEVQIDAQEETHVQD